MEAIWILEGAQFHSKDVLVTVMAHPTFKNHSYKNTKNPPFISLSEGKNNGSIRNNMKLDSIESHNWGNNMKSQLRRKI